MSTASKNKDKDKDVKGASGKEISANNKLSTSQDISTTQTITSSSPPLEDQISTEPMVTTAASSSSSTPKSNEVSYQYQQNRLQQQRWEDLLLWQLTKP